MSRLINLKITNDEILAIFTISLMVLVPINYLFKDISASEAKEEKALTLAMLFKKVEKSVVQISSEEDETDITEGRLGSGFVYDTNGYIITNNHVTEGTKDLHVTFSDGTIYNGEVVGSDPYSDLSVVLVKDTPKGKLVPLELANSTSLIVGLPVAAVGNPFGLSGSLTEGIISGLERLLPSSEENLFGEQTVGTFNIPNVIQTDAAINPGNSGGPLLNLDGKVIGITSAIFSNTGVYAGVGFAIESNTISKIVPELIAKGSYKHPWIGITGVDVTPDIAEKMNLTEARGFLVIDVNSDSPADRAGIQGGDIVDRIDGREIELGGDVIIAIDGNPVRKIADVLSHLEREKTVGDKTSITVIRNGTVQEKNMILLERPESGTFLTEKRVSLGISGTDVTPDIAEKMNLTEARGFLVMDVNSNSSADKAGIRGGYKVDLINNTLVRIGGDVITGIDNKTIQTVTNITDYIDSKKDGDVVDLHIIRAGKKMTINAKLELLPTDIPQEFQREDSGEMIEELKKQCVENFSMDICRFLFK